MSSSTRDKPTPTDTTDSSSSTAKYGDSDLASKRRKPFDSDPNYASFEQEVLTHNSDLSSTWSDFKGGLLSDYVPKSAKTTNPSTATNPAYISPTPSETSGVFENTFGVLQSQIDRSRNRQRTYLRRISEEYVPSLASFMQDSLNVSMIHEEESEGPATSFELQYAAAERLKEKRLAGKTNIGYTSSPITSKRLNPDVPANSSEDQKEKIESPLNELLYDFHTLGLDISTTATSEQSSNFDETVVNEEEGDYPESVYHIARGKDGKMYLRMVKSMLVDEVLCGNRVSQMTRAYDDIEAVTRLLEEKEKDLELTVQIGKELLTQNGRLEKRIVDLEGELKKSNEERAQLAHDLHQKSELIAVLTNDIDEGTENETPTAAKSINLDLLQRKIASLQDENISLKREAQQLWKQTDEVEEQERKLMEDITTQLNSANSQYDGISLELERQKEENRLQHEQILSLQARLAEAEMRLHQLTAENDEQVSLLSITKENQNMLTTELAECKERYQEVLALLQETQEQLKRQKKKSQPQVRSSFLTGLGIPQPDSLHSELMESSLYSDNSLDSGISTDRMGPLPPFRKVFETVRCAAKNGHYSDGMSHLGAMSLSSSSQPRMSAIPYVPSGMAPIGGSYHRPSSVYSGSTYPSYDSSSLGVKTMSCESLTSSQSEDGYPTQPAGIPGAPGAKDLEAALKRLTPAEVLVRRTMLAHAPAGTYTYDENPHQAAALGFRTPDSIMSTGLSAASGLSHGSSSNQWRLPERLQIVKPMEGSQTLHHWSRLAQPNLSGLLEDRPGVQVRGGRGLEELGMQVYSLSDVEEDMDDNPGKQFQESGCIYTFTNSTVMHPDDGTAALLGLSVASSRIASNSTSKQSTCPPTPPSGMSRRNSCSTFSVNMGLASILNERGIKAITPSALNTPAGPNYTPTVTPCNSPEGSPTRSRSPEPLFGGILSSGADMIRRKLLGDVERPTRNHPRQQKVMLSRLEKRALRSLRLMEKVESVGLENIIGTHPNSMSQLSSGIASRSASPMAQLTSLKNLSSSSCTMGASGLTKGISNDSLRSFIDSDLPSSLSSTDVDSDDSMPVTKPTATTDKNEASSTAAHSASLPSAASSPVDIRLKQMQRQKSRRNLKNGMGGQRPDLGTVGGRMRPDLGRVESRASLKKPSSASSQQPQHHQQQRTEEKVVAQSMTQSFVGTISSLFFGRKGGWL